MKYKNFKEKTKKKSNNSGSSKKDYGKHMDKKSAPRKKSVKNMSQDEVRKQKLLDLMKDDMYVPMKEKELAIIMQVSSEDRPLFNKVLQELVRDNLVTISKRGKYTISDGINITGTFTSNAAGFGFVTVEGQKDDYFIPRDNVNGAFHGDTVVIKPLFGRRGERTEAEVVAIVSRGIEHVVGTFDKGKGFAFVITDDKHFPDVFISERDFNGAKTGHKVVVKLTSYGENGKKPEGIVEEILGRTGDKGVDVLGIIRGFGLPENFDKDVIDASESFTEDVTIPEGENRLDLRDKLMVTIDGTDTKDIDDAVSLEMDGDKYILGVHIADVSEYVTENSILDKEAIKRGTSVYLADRVIPMLPKRLSNGLCSLNEGVDRLAMSCIMTFDKNGNQTDYQIAETIINVNECMNYPSVNKIINGDAKEQELHPVTSDMLIKMNELAVILRKKRFERGSVDFDSKESKFELDDNGVPVNIYAYEANDATRLIEDFMLAANETVASHIFWQDKPFLYRVHELPDEDKIQTLALMVKNFDYYIKGEKDEMHPKELQKLIETFRGRPEEPVVTRLTLRSMKQARYSPECLGHFGLALKQYTHFTSPIRRYPDLQIHRILKEDMRGRLTEKRINHYNYILEDVAKKCSKLERRAEEAEREVEKLKKAEYMLDHIGEEYDGIISGVTNYGAYVELDNTVEGLIHISKFPGDYYEYDEKRLVIEGISSGNTYSLGMQVKIRVSDVDVNLKTVDFDIVYE